MEQIACTCEGLPAHTHTSEMVVVRCGELEKKMPRHVYEMNEQHFAEKGCSIVGFIPSDIRLWVDWKAVAREQMLAD